MSVRKKSIARVISSQTVFKGRVFNVVSDQIEEPGNVVVKRQVVRHPGAIVVLAVDDSGREPRVLLERQYRYAANARLWELPAGRIEPGETKLDAAKRELLEETGYSAANWQPALSFYASPGFLDEVLHVFLAQGLIKGHARPEADVRIAVRFVPLKQAVRMAMTGKIVDAKTIASVLWLENKASKRPAK
ncbi:MAG TPA: NUDIX hydrolase [Candidatus Angelobacter sp.]|nr:NUDIX hydrolase [Candidatus Angelobacter sp.]